MEEKVIVLDLGASNLRMALVSNKGQLSQKKKISLSGKVRKPIDIINLINSLVKECLEKNERAVKAISVVAAGSIDKEKGILVNPPNIPFKEISLLEPVKKEFNLPVFLTNDCNAAVWGEKIFGIGKGYENLVYLTISSGIGGGIISNNHLLLGENNSAGEVGHFIIENEYNLLCGCGGRGHWEAYASGKNLINFFWAWLKKNRIKEQFQLNEPRDIFSLAQKGNRVILKFLEKLGEINAKGVSNIIVAYNPALIILGGAIALNNQELIIPYFQKHIDKFLKTPEIKISQLADEVTLFGGAAIVFFPPE
jgi:glucokinase